MARFGYVLVENWFIDVADCMAEKLILAYCL